MKAQLESKQRYTCRKCFSSFIFSSFVSHERKEPQVGDFSKNIISSRRRSIIERLHFILFSVWRPRRLLGQILPSISIFKFAINWFLNAILLAYTQWYTKNILFPDNYQLPIRGPEMLINFKNRRSKQTWISKQTYIISIKQRNSRICEPCWFRTYVGATVVQISAKKCYSHISQLVRTVLHKQIGSFFCLHLISSPCSISITLDTIYLIIHTLSSKIVFLHVISAIGELSIVRILHKILCATLDTPFCSKDLNTKQRKNRGYREIFQLFPIRREKYKAILESSPGLKLCCIKYLPHFFFQIVCPSKYIALITDSALGRRHIAARYLFHLHRWL